MSIQSPQGRVQAGVPTGGQFAAGTHAESEVSLDDVWSRAHEATNEAQLRTAQAVAKRVLERCPDAAWLDLQTTDQDSDSMTTGDILDAHGERLLIDDEEEFAAELDDMTWVLTENGAWQQFDNENDTRVMQGRRYGAYSMDVRAAAAQTFPADASSDVPSSKRPAYEIDDSIPRPLRSTAAANRVMKDWVDLPNENTDPTQVQEMRNAALSDALADLRHWADANGVDMFEAMDRSYQTYLSDKDDR